MNATGLRDQSLRVYRRVDIASDGFNSSTFQFTGEWWGRLDETRATVSRMQDRLQMKLDAVAEFADEVDIPATGLVKDLTDNRVWRVCGVNSVRLLRRVQVGLERVSDEAFASFKVLDTESPLDGTHLVEPSAT